VIAWGRIGCGTWVRPWARRGRVARNGSVVCMLIEVMVVGCGYD
jgi:hypothetical protein